MSQLSILCYLMQWREKADQTRVSVSVTCYLLCQRQVIRAVECWFLCWYCNRDLECKYSERERMMGGSTRVKGTTWSPGGRWGPWCTPTMCSMYSLELVKWSVRVWLLTVLVSVQSTSPFPASSSSAHGEECPKALKNNQPPHCTLLPPHFPAKIKEERVTKRTGQPCPGRCSPASARPCTLCWPAESNQIFL